MRNIFVQQSQLTRCQPSHVLPAPALLPDHEK
jgi:hypothetical protein